MAVMDVAVPHSLDSRTPARSRRIMKPRLPDWTPAQRVAFRFAFAYLVLYDVPQLLATLPLPGAIAGVYYGTMQGAAIWIGAHVLGLARPLVVVPTGSGDTMIQFIVNGIILVLALAAGLIWNLAARRREYRRLHEWLRIVVRFSLAFILFGYGFAKIFPNQFPQPSLERLVEPIGELSPMGLLWTFMGYSAVYNLFTGMGEALGSLLLCFRRTTTAGSLLLIAVMSNVVILNFTYDVPVKLYSTNLLLMAVFLAAPDLPRLYDLLIRRRTATPEPLKPLFATRRMHLASQALRAALLLYVVGMGVVANAGRYRAAGPRAPLPAVFGIYDIQTLTKNGKDVPLLVTDRALWRRVTFSQGDRVGIRTMGDSVLRYLMKIDTKTRTLLLTPRLDSSLARLSFAYKQTAPDRLMLVGQVGRDTIVARLSRVDESKYLLLNRGFNWVQEQPFNR